MLPIAENLEVQKNNFSKWINLGFAVLISCFTFYQFYEKGTILWYGVFGAILFGGIYYQNIKNKIITDQFGFKYIGLLKSTEVLWKEISAINYNMQRVSNSVQLSLKITYPNNKTIEFSVKQFKKKQMQRFFEMLHEQCVTASKNEYFLKQLDGALTWKEQIKMIYK